MFMGTGNGRGETCTLAKAVPVANAVPASSSQIASGRTTARGGVSDVSFTMPKHQTSPLRRVGLFCLALAMFTVVSVARADDVPKFSDPDVTAFAKSYGDFTTEYISIMQDYMAAAKSGDAAKMQASGQKVQDLQTKAAALQTESTKLTTKLKPEETEKFSTYLQGCAQKMVDALK